MSEVHNNHKVENTERIESNIDKHENIQKALTLFSQLHPKNENIQTIHAMTKMLGGNPKFLGLIHDGIEKLHDQIKIVEEQGKRKASNIHKNMIVQLEARETKPNINDLLQGIG